MKDTTSPTHGFIFYQEDGRRYRQAWRAGDEPFALVGDRVELPVTDFSTPAYRLDCKYRGRDVIDLVPCETCAGNVKLKVYACERFHQATIAMPVEGAACCATCDDYEPEDG